MSDIDYWHKKINGYATSKWARKPSIFATEVLSYFPKRSSILELGCGLGQDGVYFARHQHNVTQLDLVDKRLPDNPGLPFLQHDLNELLTFQPNSFDVIYAHLSLHYFSELRTKALINEIHTALKSDGIVAFLVNSIHDPEFAQGEQIEKDFYQVGAIAKRFFAIDSVRTLMKHGFETILLDDSGRSYKDDEVETTHLVRYIGKKKQRIQP